MAADGLNPEAAVLLAGTFINFEGGSFEGFRYTSTVGAAMSTVYGQFDRPLGFMETGLFYKRIISVYDSAQVDEPPGTVGVAPPGMGTPSPGMGLARSFFTVRVQPIERLSFDLNHNYFRDVPTFDTALVGTGLLDKYLFQGFSAGVRGEIVRHVTLYTTLGASSRSGRRALSSTSTARCRRSPMTTSGSSPAALLPVIFSRRSASRSACTT